MKKIITAMIFLISSLINLTAQDHKTALLLIDIQDFYFPGGKSALDEPAKAADNEVWG